MITKIFSKEFITIKVIMTSIVISYVVIKVNYKKYKELNRLKSNEIMKKRCEDNAYKSFTLVAFLYGCLVSRVHK